MDSQDDLLDQDAEAQVIGTSKASVSRARAQHPSHPANGPHRVVRKIGKNIHILAPRDEVLAWWPPAGSGLSPAGWQYLRSVAAGQPDGDLGTPRIVSVLRAKGLLDDVGQLTDAARALLTPITAASNTATD